MRKSFLPFQERRLIELYKKLEYRLSKHFRKGRFHKLSIDQQKKLLSRIERIKNQLSFFNNKIKWKVTTGITALSLLSNSLSAHQALGPAGTEFRVNTFTTGNQQNASIAIDDIGNFVITWESENPNEEGKGIYAQRFNPEGVPKGAEFLVNTYTNDDQSKPVVDMDSDGNFVISWQSFDQDGDKNGIYAQAYNADGTSNGSEFKVSTFTTADQSDPAIAMNSDGAFVITWQSYDQDGDKEGIYAQRFNADVSKSGNEFPVNNYTTAQQASPAIAISEEGDFIIVWSSYNQDGDKEGIFAQHYNSDGTIQHSEFQVNDTTTDQQSFPVVAMDSEGDFVISWQSLNQDGDESGIYAQRYNDEAVIQNAEFRVNSFTLGDQVNPAITMNEDGDFVITWQSSYDQDGDGNGIYAQRYSYSGYLQESEFRINTYTNNDQINPVIAMDLKDEFVIAWDSDRDGDGYGIYTQRYGNTTPLIQDQSFSINENSANGAFVGTVIATDPDEGQTLSFNILSGNTNNAFKINLHSGALTVNGAIDYETVSQYTLSILVSDNFHTPTTDTAIVTININNLVETKITESQFSSSLNLYPIPAKEKVYINIEGKYLARILDLSGSVIKEASLSESTLNIEDLKAGIYILEIYKDGEKATKKMLVE